MLRAGYTGALAAWVGFTLPSAALLVAFASGAASLPVTPVGAGLLHGLKLVAVAIVAQAVWGMARSLCPDPQRAAIGVAAAAVVLLAPTTLGQVGAIVLGALAGLRACRGDVASPPQTLRLGVSRIVGIVALALFTALLLLCFVPAGDGPLALFAAFYRSGALVFGGGHVVLPLLDDAVVKPGWIDTGTFLAGYGAAQAVPGPLFTFAAYLGAAWPAPLGGIAGASLALVAIFLPGLLLQLAALPFRDAIRSRRGMQAAMRGINAAVVGILGAALYDPVWKSAVLGPEDVAIALAGFVLLVRWNVPPLLVVLLCAATGVATRLA